MLNVPYAMEMKLVPSSIRHIIGRGLVKKADVVGDGAQYTILTPPDVRKYIARKDTSESMESH